MSRFDELPPDQAAALSLLLNQRKSYAEVAALLGISERAVHDRAHAALAVLAPAQARQLPPDRRLEVGDYLLGQQNGVADGLRVRTFIGSSHAARAWAAALASELAPLAGGNLPEIPGLAAAGPAGTPSRAPRTPQLPSSRVGGAVLLAVLAAVVIVAVVLLTGGSSSNKPTASGTVSTSSTATKTGPTIDAQIALKPTLHGSHTVGVVYVLSEGTKRAFFVQVQHIPQTKGFYYALWLYNSHTSALPLSKSPAVGSSHSFAGGSALPSNAGEFHRILLTTETSAHPTHPGHVVLSGAFSLG
ncbi:MAG TPA: sigma-70 region 4 domain-containing protein [Solirubrobacteraceae bacterium]|jgi:hypothetical protein|nr:sigma-70 region 4 domain-containing protein [Solirubrobacteraceae bacterium]